jgi:uncharacterized protein YdeI (YjbR/CyaY-like superfamily)
MNLQNMVKANTFEIMYLWIKRTNNLKMISAKTVEEYFSIENEYSNEMNFLRELIRRTEMDETLKWGIPVYTIQGKNVLGIASFKSYVGIWFYQGVFLKDDQKKLINAQEGVTKAMRQWRFTNLEEIKNDKNLILAYLEEAIENQKLGKEIKPNFKKSLEICNELQASLDEDEKFNEAFEKLTLGKRREYAEYISQAKRVETKNSRLEKIKPMINSGVGLHDKYKQ